MKVLGWLLIVPTVALTWVSLAGGFLDVTLFRYLAGIGALLCLITARDLITDNLYPWWTGGRRSQLGNR